MQIDFPEVFEPLFTQEARFYVSDGGRGGGRSWSFARALLIQGAQRPLRILCAREYQNSIKDSVKRLLDDQIEALRLSHFYRSTQESLTGINGTEYLFRGLHNNITEIKSTEGVDICWVEEAEKVSEESWSFLIPTIRKAGSKIYITFNPYKEKDPTYQRFIVNPPPGTIRMRAGHAQNPWFPEVLKAEMDHDKRTNYDRYLWIWEGEPLGISDAQVFKDKFIVDEFETPETTFYHGVDWGFAQDPTAAVRCFIMGNNLYIDMEAGGVSIDIDKTPDMLDQIPTLKNSVSYADCARPETISYMNQHGYMNMKACKKWTGSVEDGIAYLKSFDKIVIHPRCKSIIEEFNLYQYKIDKQTGEILPQVVDKNNHYVDALRYALQSFIMAPSMRFVYQYDGSAVSIPAITPKDTLYVGQLIDEGFFRPVVCTVKDGAIITLAELEPDQMIDAPWIVRKMYTQNPIVWYLDISQKDVFPSYRQAILDAGIQLQVGTIVPSEIERPVIINKLIASQKLKIGDTCTRLKSALSSRLLDKSGSPEKGDGASSGHWYCNSLEYVCYRISSSLNL